MRYIVVLVVLLAGCATEPERPAYVPIDGATAQADRRLKEYMARIKEDPYSVSIIQHRWPSTTSGVDEAIAEHDRKSDATIQQWQMRRIEDALRD